MFGIMDRVMRTATRRELPEETRYEKERRLRHADRTGAHDIELEQRRNARTRFWI